MRTDFDKWWEDYYDCVFDGVGHAASQYDAAQAAWQAAWQAAQPEWQPIETAPDREYILILVDGQITGVGSTYLGDWWASMPNGEVCELNEPPTHWMPQPEAP